MARTAKAPAEHPSVADLPAIRRRLIEVVERRHAVEHAPVDADSFGQRIANLIAADQERAADALLLVSVAQPGWIQASGNIQAGTVAERYPLGFAAILQGADVVADRLKALAASKLVGGLSDGERSAELARLDGEASDLAIVEERIIREAESEGRMVPRRADADPAVVLARSLMEK